MKTSALTNGAMSIALFCLILWFNQQFGFSIESLVNWVFAIPILLFTAKYGLYSGFIVMISMGITTFLFGSFSTWFYSWSALVIGYVYGTGIFKKKNHLFNFCVSTILSSIMYFLMVIFWASIFDLDLKADFFWIQSFLPFLEFESYCFIFIFFMALLQTLCIHVFAIVLCNRLRIEIRSVSGLESIQISPVFGILSIALWLLFFFGQNMIEYRIWNIMIQILFFLDCLILDFNGTTVLIEYVLLCNKKKFIFFVVLGAFIPIIQVGWIILGELDSLVQIRKNWML